MNSSDRDRGGFVLLAGGILLVVSLFLHWEDSFTAWHEFPNLRIIMLVIAIVGIGFAVLDETGQSPALPDLIPLIIAGLGLAMFGFSAGWELQISGAIGVWCAVVGSLGVALGAYAARRHDLVLREARAPGSVPPGRL
ncbi:MAG TPA: hypothetical protein VGF70_01210 [Solirubrobacteraceae bacterium]